MDVSEVSGSIEDGEVFLVLVDYNNFRDVSNSLAINLLSEREGVYFTTDRTFEEVRDEIEFDGGSTEKLYFIDVVSKKRGIRTADENVELVDSPTAFNDINLAFSKFYGEIGEGSFVIMDSFTSYLLFGNLKPIGNFVKKMTDKARENGSKFFIVALKTQIDDEVVEKIMSFCDKKFDLVGKK